jgi:hypothetical protein
MHLNKARPHNSKKSREHLGATRAQRLPHLADSTDLALCHFFLFGYLKEKLQEIVIRNRKDQMSKIQRRFDEIDKETLVAISGSWIERVCRAIQQKGNTFRSKRKIIKFIARLNKQRVTYEFIEPDTYINCRTDTRYHWLRDYHWYSDSGNDSSICMVEQT